MYEYLCKDIHDEMSYLRFHFVDPKDYGYDQSIINEKDKYN